MQVYYSSCADSIALKLLMTSARLSGELVPLVHVFV